ncbi:hypothetical protein D0869_01438 [Hortaea werneckii]|uniref:Uncharacterized protein n=1 Tax=Hortaea werneckii TaxID=91943 RepID=A0A3M6XCZ4_HORWE|nr:hypothetical protein D0869_01438 [Hortaea werneckii]
MGRSRFHSHADQDTNQTTRAAIMSYVPAFERRYKSIGNVISAITDHASRDTVIEEGKLRLSKEVDVLNTALAHAAEKGRVEDVSHLTEELNGWLKHQVDVGERTALAALRQENAAQGEVAEQELSRLRDKGREKDTRIRELEASTTSHQDAAQQLRDKTQTQAVTLEKKEETIQSLQVQLEQQTQASVTEVTQLKSQSEQSRNDLLAQLEASENQATDLKRKWDAERRRTDDLQPKAVALAEKEKALQSLKAQSAQQTEAGVTSVTHLKIKLEQTCSELEASKGSAAALKESLDAERRRAEHLESKAVALKETQKNLQAKLKQQTDASVTEVTDWKNRLEQTRLELQTQLEAKEAQAAGLEKTLDAERARTDDLQGQKETNSNQALRLYHSLNAERDRVEQLEVQLGAKRSRIEELQSQLESSVTEQERLHAIVNISLHGQFETITAEKDTTKSQIQEGAKACGTRVKELEEALRKEREQVRQLGIQLSTMAAEKNDFDREQSRKLEDHILSLKETLGAKDPVIAGFQDSLEEKERETEWLRTSNDKAWAEAHKTVGIANEAVKEKAAIHVSHNLRKQGEERFVVAESAKQRTSKLFATVGQTTYKDIECFTEARHSVYFHRSRVAASIRARGACDKRATSYRDLGSAPLARARLDLGQRFRAGLTRPRASGPEYLLMLIQPREIDLRDGWHLNTNVEFLVQSDGIPDKSPRSRFHSSNRHAAAAKSNATGISHLFRECK